MYVSIHALDTQLGCGTLHFNITIHTYAKKGNICDKFNWHQQFQKIDLFKKKKSSFFRTMTPRNCWKAAVLFVPLNDFLADTPI